MHGNFVHTINDANCYATLPTKHLHIREKMLVLHSGVTDTVFILIILLTTHTHTFNGPFPGLPGRAFQFTIRIDSICYANRFVLQKIGLSIH